MFHDRKLVCGLYLVQETPLDKSVSMYTSVTSSGSELDPEGGFIDDQEICATCVRQAPECSLKQTLHSLSPIILLCSVKCQRENWIDHKFACSVVAAQRKTALGTSHNY